MQYAIGRVFARAHVKTVLISIQVFPFLFLNVLNSNVKKKSA